MSRRAFEGSLAAIALLVFVQSAAHSIAVGALDSTDSIVDLDRSNAIPDVVSTGLIAAATGGALALAWRTKGTRRLVAALTVACLVLIGFDDVAGVDRNAAAAATLIVTGLAIAATAGLTAAAGSAGYRAAVTIAAGLVALVATLFVGQLPELDQWFERARGDSIIEAQIVLKQGLELAGWALVALGLWDEVSSIPPSRESTGLSSNPH